MRFGLQLYGASALMASDPAAFGAKLRAMGYAQVEPCAFLGLDAPPNVAGLWTRAMLWDRLPLLRDAGLEVPSLHVFSADLAAALPDMTRLTEEYGVRQFVLPCPHPASAADLRALARGYRAAADALAPLGAELLVHNGEGCMSDRLDGKPLFEALLEACRGKVFAQADVGWLLHDGADPETFLWRNRERVHSLHYKDFTASGVEAPLGQGTLDTESCFQFARAMGVPQIVDTDVCSEDDLCSAVKLLGALTDCRSHTSSKLVILNTDTGAHRLLRSFDGVIEAPNWLPDGDTLVFNEEGRIRTYSIRTGTVQTLDTGACVRCNNDHVPSPDGSLLAVSCNPDDEGFKSHIYIIDPRTGKVRQVTENSPSFLHGWSPDGAELAYCAFREGVGFGGYDVDIYSIPVSGGAEKRLTDGLGYNDGPEYAPDGQTIWYNSTRSGLMQVWRMGRDGSAPVQITHNDANSWFPHVSPDGKRVVYLTFRKGELDPAEHLPNMRVQVRIMDADGGNDRPLMDFFGGQGSINVNSWSPDSRELAMVIYELHHLG